MLTPRKNQLLHAPALKLAAQGQPISAEFFAKQSAFQSNLRDGVVLVMPYVVSIGGALSGD